MRFTQTLHDAAEATREYAKGIDRATAIRHAFAFWIVFMVIVSVVSPAVVVTADHGGTHIDDFEDGDTTVGATGWSGWSGDTGSLSVESGSPITGSFSGNITVTGETSLTATKDSGSVTPTRIAAKVRISEVTNDNSDSVNFRIYDGTTQIINIRFVQSDQTILGSATTQVGTWEPGVVYRIELKDIDYGSDTYDLYINGTQAENDAAFVNPGSDVSKIQFISDSTASGDTFQLYYDSVQLDGSDFSTTSTVSGTVTYASNDTAVEGASITVNASSATDTTDASGAYSLALDNGTYEITATKGDFANSITVTVSGSDLTGQDIVLSSETLTLDVPTQMFPNETAAYEVTLEGQDVTDNATVTSSDPTNLTVNEATNELEATSDVSFAGEITITAEHDGLTASRNVTVANLSASNVALMQNAADMTAAIWGDVQGPSGERPGGTQLTMRVLFVALLIGAAIATHASGFAGIGGITLIVVMGWFMGWVSDGMALVTVFTGLFIGLNLAANIDYSVRR